MKYISRLIQHHVPYFPVRGWTKLLSISWLNWWILWLPPTFTEKNHSHKSHVIFLLWFSGVKNWGIAESTLRGHSAHHAADFSPPRGWIFSRLGKTNEKTLLANEFHFFLSSLFHSWNPLRPSSVYVCAPFKTFLRTNLPIDAVWHLQIQDENGQRHENQVEREIPSCKLFHSIWCQWYFVYISSILKATILAVG